MKFHVKKKARPSLSTQSPKLPSISASQKNNRWSKNLSLWKRSLSTENNRWTYWWIRLSRSIFLRKRCDFQRRFQRRSRSRRPKSQTIHTLSSEQRKQSILLVERLRRAKGFMKHRRYLRVRSKSDHSCFKKKTNHKWTYHHEIQTQNPNLKTLQIRLVFSQLRRNRPKLILILSQWSSLSSTLF